MDKMEKIRELIYTKINSQLQKAYDKHGYAPWSRHEFYGILKEEFEEMWDVIKSDGPSDNLIYEIIDIMLVCQRFLETNDKNHPLWKYEVEKYLEKND